MIFFVNVAVNIHDQFQNIRLQFPALPALRELAAAVEAQFHSLLLVDRMCLLDEYAGEWVELYSAAQLTTDCQVLVAPQGLRGATAVRPESIPPAIYTIACDTVPPPCGLAKKSIEQRKYAHRGYEQGNAVYRARAVFDALDAERKGYLLYTDVCRAVESQRLAFTNYSADALFALASGGKGHRIRFGQWAVFAATDPATVEALYAALPHKPRCGQKKRKEREKTVQSVGDWTLGRSRAVLAYVEARLAPETSAVETMHSKWAQSHFKK